MTEPKRYREVVWHPSSECEPYSERVEDSDGPYVLYTDYQHLQSLYKELQESYDILSKECTMANVKLIKIGQILEK